jgi:hypothetical protein
MSTPTYTFVPPQASPQAQMLGQEIAGLVRERRVQRPDLAWTDVILALAIARETLSRESGGSNASRLASLVAGLLAVVMLAVGALFFVAQ